MRLSEVKNSENKVTLNCQLLITEEKTQKNDNYLKLEFSDRTKLYINIFNSNKKYNEYRSLGLNKLLYVEIEIQFRGLNNQGFEEYNLYSIKKLEQPSLIDCVDIPALIDELRVICASIKDKNLRELIFAMCRYKNKELLNKLFECPVTEKSAYSFKGGTLAHIVRTCKLCDAIGGVYNSWNFNLNKINETVNIDLLKTITIFHDLGKAEKYYFENNQINKTFKGELLSDSELSIDLFRDIVKSSGIQMLEEQIVLIEHAIASSKGKTELGAILDPRTKEAEVFASIERIECTMGNYEYMRRISIGDEFQKLFNKQYYTTNYEDLEINENLKTLL